LIRHDRRQPGPARVAVWRSARSGPGGGRARGGLRAVRWRARSGTWGRRRWRGASRSAGSPGGSGSVTGQGWSSWYRPGGCTGSSRWRSGRCCWRWTLRGPWRRSCRSRDAQPLAPRRNTARTPDRHPRPPQPAPQVTLRLTRPRSEETVVAEDPGRATLIDKEECSLTEDSLRAAHLMPVSPGITGVSLKIARAGQRFSQDKTTANRTSLRIILVEP
jgi:hypothetical protein